MIKQEDLQIIVNKGANFRLSHHLKPSSILNCLENNFDSYIDKWCEKEKKIKSFQSWKNLIISRTRNKIYTNLNSSKTKSLIYNVRIKQAIANLQNEFVIVPVDKANNKLAIICQKLYCDVLTRELCKTNVYEKVNLEDENLIEKTEELLLKKFNIRINDNDKKFPFLYWTVTKPRLIAGAARRPTRIATTKLSLILKEPINKLKTYCSSIKKFSNFSPYWSVNNSLQVIDSLTMVSAKRIESIDFATMYLSLNEVLENLKMVIKKSFLLSSKRFLKIETYNKKAIWTNCCKTTVTSRCYSLDMIFDFLEFVLYNQRVRGNEL